MRINNWSIEFFSFVHTPPSIDKGSTIYFLFCFFSCFFVVSFRHPPTCQAWARLEEERAGVKRDDPSPTRRRASAKAAQDSTNTAGTLSPELAARVSGLLLPSAVTLLEALVASSRLEKAMEERQGTVCQCMGQAVAQVCRPCLMAAVVVACAGGLVALCGGCVVLACTEV